MPATPPPKEKAKKPKNLGDFLLHLGVGTRILLVLPLVGAVWLLIYWTIISKQQV